MSGNMFPAFFKVGCNNIVLLKVKVYVVMVKMKIVMVTVHVVNTLVILLI